MRRLTRPGQGDGTDYWAQTIGGWEKRKIKRHTHSPLISLRTKLESSHASCFKKQGCRGLAVPGRHYSATPVNRTVHTFRSFPTNSSAAVSWENKEEEEEMSPSFLSFSFLLPAWGDRKRRRVAVAVAVTGGGGGG